MVGHYKPNKLFVPDEEQIGELSFKATGSSQTNTVTWKFRNLKSIVLPAPAITENFDSYAEFTYPPGWTQINFTDTDTAGDNSDALNSDTYKPWVIADRARLEALKGRIFATLAPDQFVNGEAVTVEEADFGNVLYAESDVRGGNQVQFLYTSGYNLSNVTNVVMTFSSLYEQNQDNIGAVEYSVDKGTNWLPIVYFLDFVDGGGDIRLNPDGTVDAVATLTNPNPDTANWTRMQWQKAIEFR